MAKANRHAIKIEKNVPMPVRARGAESPYPLLEMKVGDSFLIRCADKKEAEKRRMNVANAACHLRKWRAPTHGAFRITTKILPEGVRVWRIT